MSVLQLEQAIASLPPDEPPKFTEWFEESKAEQADRQIEQDILAGKLDHLAKKADEAFEAGECTPL